MCGSDIFLGIIAILFPPIAVWVKRGICSADSLINICLCCLGFLPGLVHSWYIIASYPDPTYDELAQDDSEQGRVTYYYIQQGGEQGGQRRVAAPQQQQAKIRSDGRQQQQQRGYGTVGGSSQSAGQQYQRQEGMRAGGAGGEAAPPPPYNEAIRGDHKVQSQD